MAKIKVSVCEMCRKESCSGDVFVGYDEENKKQIKVCESKTSFIILKEIQWLAWALYEKDCEQAKAQDTCVTPVKYYKQAIKQSNMTAIPIVRVYFVECGNYPEVKPENSRELLFAPFSQFVSDHIYNNLCKNIKEVGSS